MSWSDNFAFYLEAVNEQICCNSDLSNCLGNKFSIHREGVFPDVSACNIAIIGVNEDRGSVDNKGCTKGADEVRKYLYQLFDHFPDVRVADLGNINGGEAVSDTEVALQKTLSELLLHNILPIVIGGSHDLAYANYAAYEKLETTVNVVDVDSTFDLGDLRTTGDSATYLSKIVLHQPNYLFNYSNLGYQTYLVDPETLNLMQKLFFDTYRLGVISKDIKEAEPVVRNADIVSIDIGAVRMSDAPGNARANPNGFYGEQVCQICKYAGMSDKLSSIGFYEFNPAFDRNGQTASLLAEMIWFVMEGFSQRKKEFPLINKSEFTEYRVASHKSEEEILFYKSKRTDKWWMKVPYNVGPGGRFERHHLVPCSYKDYQSACNEEVPDKWWQTYQKLI